MKRLFPCLGISLYNIMTVNRWGRGTEELEVHILFVKIVDEGSRALIFKILETGMEATWYQEPMISLVYRQDIVPYSGRYGLYVNDVTVVIGQYQYVHVPSRTLDWEFTGLVREDMVSGRSSYGKQVVCTVV